MFLDVVVLYSNIAIFDSEILLKYLYFKSCVYSILLYEIPDSLYRLIIGRESEFGSSMIFEGIRGHGRTDREANTR